MIAIAKSHLVRLQLGTPCKRGVEREMINFNDSSILRNKWWTIFRSYTIDIKN